MYRALSTDARLEDSFSSLLRQTSVTLRLSLCLFLCFVLATAMNADWICNTVFHVMSLAMRIASKHDNPRVVSILPLSSLLVLTVLSLVGILWVFPEIDKSRRRLLLSRRSSLLLWSSFVVVGVLLWVEQQRYVLSKSSGEYVFNWHITTTVSFSITTRVFDNCVHIALSLGIATGVFSIASTLVSFCFAYIAEVFPYRARATFVSLSLASLSFADLILSQWWIRHNVVLYALCEVAAHERDCISAVYNWIGQLINFTFLSCIVCIPVLLLVVYFSLPETAGKLGCSI
jgi:hypothetical protein